MNNNILSSVAKAIIAKHKGVLAADESNPTITRGVHKIRMISLMKTIPL